MKNRLGLMKTVVLILIIFGLSVSTAEAQEPPLLHRNMAAVAMFRVVVRLSGAEH